MPDDIEGIKTQTINAMESDFDDDFQSLIKKEFDWSKTAEQTLEAYKKVL